LSGIADSEPAAAISAARRAGCAMLVRQHCAGSAVPHHPRTSPMSLDLPPRGDEPFAGDDFELLYDVVYCSRAAASVDDAAITRIITTAQRHNAAQGITGLLVFGAGIFFQWIEGPRHQVLQLMATIRSDPRHDHVVPLSESEEVRERLFPTWNMELVSTDDIRDVLLDAMSLTTDPRNATSLSLMLQRLDSDELAGLGAGSARAVRHVP
jgi:hypothetical protein